MQACDDRAIGSSVRSSYVSAPCPVVICPYLCTSEASRSPAPSLSPPWCPVNAVWPVFAECGVVFGVVFGLCSRVRVFAERCHEINSVCRTRVRRFGEPLRLPRCCSRSSCGARGTILLLLLLILILLILLLLLLILILILILLLILGAGAGPPSWPHRWNSKPPTHIYIYIYMCMCIYIYIYMYTVYMHTFIYVYIYIYIYIYIDPTPRDLVSWRF